MKNFAKEFKDFILKGNVVEIAVGLILAFYFKGVVDAFTNGILLAFVAAVFGEPNFDRIVIPIGDADLLVGVFLNAVINLVLVGFVLFLVIKAYNAMKARMGPGEDTEATEVELLTEIRDALKSRN